MYSVSFCVDVKKLINVDHLLKQQLNWCTSAHCNPPSSPVASIWAMIIVWRLRGKIMRTALLYAVLFYDSVVQLARTASDPQPLLIRPATTNRENIVHRPVLLFFFCLLSVVNKMTIWWTEPVICKFSTSASVNLNSLPVMPWTDRRHPARRFLQL